MDGVNSDKRLCSKAYRASLDCIEKNYENKDVACREYFDAYKVCKKQETKERQLKNNGGKEATFFPWG